MRVNDLIEKERESVDICDQYIAESNGLPLYRSLPREGLDARRVKVRQRKVDGTMVEAFNEAFKDRSRNIFQRAVFATTTPGDATDDHEPFYIFPVNGYRYMYCTEVTRTKTDFQNAIDALFERFDNVDEAVGVLKELLTMSYVDTKLEEGIQNGSEIIIYNIPSFIAVRCSAVDSYEDAIDLLD